MENHDLGLGKDYLSMYQDHNHKTKIWQIRLHQIGRTSVKRMNRQILEGLISKMYKLLLKFSNKVTAELLKIDKIFEQISLK